MSVPEKEGNGVPPPASANAGAGPNQQGGPNKFKAYKLLLDPFLVKGATKLYRFDGTVPADPTYPPVVLRDPRTINSLSRIWNRLDRLDGLELPIPKFKIDNNYVGKPPPLEVSISNLNDNVDKTFLCDLLQKYGSLEEVYIYYHPQTNKHLGLARVIFEETAAAKACVSKLHNAPVMGNVLSVFLDPFGEQCKKQYEELIVEKKPPPPTPVPKKVVEKKVPDVEISPVKSGQSKQGVQNPAPNRNQQNVLQTPCQLPIQTPGQYSVPATPYGLQTPNQFAIQTPSQYPMQSATQYPMNLPMQYPLQSPLKMPVLGANVMASVPPPLIQSSQLSAQDSLSSTPASGNADSYELEERSPKMDLDTRIKLLLKSNNKSTPFGKLLDFDVNSSDSEAEESRGKFKTGFTIRKRKSLCISRSEIFNSDSEEDTAKSKRQRYLRDDSESPPPSPFLESNDKEERRRRNGTRHHSLLSDLEEVSDDSDFDTPKQKTENRPSPAVLNTADIQLPPEPEPVTFPVNQMPYDAHQQMKEYYYPPNQNYMQQPPPPILPYGVYPPEAAYGTYPQWVGNQPFPPIDYSQIPPYYGQHLPQTECPPPPQPVNEEPPMSPASELKASTEGILKAVFERLIKELRLILRRDTDKKLIEGMTFKMYEEWFAQKLKAYKDMKQNRGKENKQLVEDRMNGQLEMTITDGSLLGLGFRANIPKLPSFKIQKKPTATPTPVVEPHKKADDDEADSDAEIQRKPKPSKRLSLSSESDLTSSSSSSSSSEAESESDEELPPPKDRNVHVKVSKGLKVEFDPWTESVSEDDSFSPAVKSAADSVVKSDAEVVQDEPAVKNELKTEENTAIRARLLTPLPPLSPERVSIEGPYVHLHDHNYGHPPSDAPEEKPPQVVLEKLKIEAVKLILKPKATKEPPPKPREVTKHKKPSVVFRKRDEDEERAILTEFLSAGVDSEDILYFKQCFDSMIVDPSQNWVSRTHWVDHVPTRFPEPKRKPNRRVHLTGSARTEGFYKLDAAEKQRHKLQWATVTRAEYSTPGTAGAVGVTVLAHQEKHQGKSQIEKSREARSQQRRILTALGTEVTSTSDLLKFNQLKFRKKNLRFQRSTIHDWGLFAAEPIAADEMVIEYVGQTIRPNLADFREAKYEKDGIGSSYLFRVDLERIVDATKCGNLSRFINHSCNPNCYAKVISIESEKKIVIYSKQPIAVNEEITYDYKFPYEEKKIQCLCGTPQCRGTLN